MRRIPITGSTRLSRPSRRRRRDGDRPRRRGVGDPATTMMRYFAGIDIGSTMTKVVIVAEAPVASFIGPTGPEHRKLAHKVMEEALRSARLTFDDLSLHHSHWLRKDKRSLRG